MQSEKKLWRLLQVAKNLNVGIASLANYLNSLGYVVQSNPNFQITQEMYDILKGEFVEGNTLTGKAKIIEMNQVIFMFLHRLYTENPDSFFFTLRRNDKLGKLSEKYWFVGDDENLIVSFWNGNDRTNKTPNIYFNIDNNGSTSVHLSSLPNSSLKLDEEATNKANFLNGLAKVLNMKQTKRNGNLINQWQKSYQIAPIENESIYITSLKQFLQTDKIEIDKLISFSEAMQPISLGIGENKIGKIDRKVFEKDLDKVLEYKNYRERGQIVKYYDELSYLKLEKLQLKHIGHFEDLELNLSKRVTILIGENGSGKSTILRAIVLALIGTNESNILDLQYPSLQNLLQMEGTKLSKINYAPQGKIDLTYEYNNKPYINSIKLQYDEKNISVDIVEENYDTTINSFGVFEADEFKTLVMGFPQVQGGANEKLDDWIPNHKLITKPHVKDVINLLYNEPADWVSSLNAWIVDLYKGDAVKQRKGEKMQNQPIIDIVFEIISDVTGRKVIFYDLINEDSPKSRVRILIDNETTPIPLDLISQGYKNVFGWIAQLVKRLHDLNYKTRKEEKRTSPFIRIKANDLMAKFIINTEVDMPTIKTKKGGKKNTNKENNVAPKKNDLETKQNEIEIIQKELTNTYATVFIDEIDTYLHPSWQTKILSVLVSRFPNIRWVVTTHSPAVITNTHHEDAAVYWIKGNQAKNMKYFYGRDFISAYYEFFGLEKRPKEIQKEINIMYDYLDQETEESIEKAKEIYFKLKVFLGDNDPDMVGAYTNLTLLNAWKDNDSN